MTASEMWLEERRSIMRSTPDQAESMRLFSAGVVRRLWTTQLFTV